jgi:hypothetical protein
LAISTALRRSEGVLRDLPDERLAVGIWHPVLRFDTLVLIDTGLETREQRGVVQGGVDGLLAVTVETLGVHENHSDTKMVS